jgi:hypothetical protein
MAKSYLEDATDFTDLEVQPMPREKSYCRDNDPRTFLCSVCKGHGTWNLIIDAYGPGKHFRASCSQCNGWGWVDAEDAACIHDDREINREEAKERKLRHEGMFYHLYECTKCHRLVSYDSSG